MTDDALLVVQSLFSVIWRIFTSWHIPGTDVTPAEMALFLAAAGIGLRLLVRFLDGNYAAASEPVSVLEAEDRRGERLKASKIRDGKLRESQRKAMSRSADKVRQRELRNSGYYNDR